MLSSNTGSASPAAEEATVLLAEALAMSLAGDPGVLLIVERLAGDNCLFLFLLRLLLLASASAATRAGLRAGLRGLLTAVVGVRLRLVLVLMLPSWGLCFWSFSLTLLSVPAVVVTVLLS